LSKGLGTLEIESEGEILKEGKKVLREEETKRENWN
jgi:hypothetical protein